MESESKTFHDGISGRDSRWWEGKMVWRGKVAVLCGVRAHGTCLVDIPRNRPGRAVTRAWFPRFCPSFPGSGGALGLLAECLGAVIALGAAAGNFWVGSALALFFLFAALDFLYLLC